MAAGFNTLATLPATLPYHAPASEARLDERPPSPTEETGSLVLRFGTAVGLAAAAAMAGALPAALRIGAGLGQDATGRVVDRPRGGIAGPYGVRRRGPPRRAGGAARLRRDRRPSCALTVWRCGRLVAASWRSRSSGARFARRRISTRSPASLLLSAPLDSRWASRSWCVRVVTILRAASAAVARGPRAGPRDGRSSRPLGWIGMRFLSRGVARARLRAGGRDGRRRPRLLAGGLFAARRSLASRRAVAVVGPPVAVAIAALGFSALGDAAAARPRSTTDAPAFAAVVDPLPGR